MSQFPNLNHYSNNAHMERMVSQNFELRPSFYSMAKDGKLLCILKILWYMYFDFNVMGFPTGSRPYDNDLFRPYCDPLKSK